MIHLDTNFLIRALVSGSRQERRLLAWLDGPEPVAVSAVAWAEFLCGPVSAELADLARTLLGDPVPLNAAEAETAAALFKTAGRRRGSLLDCLVAATALQAGAALATENARDFERFKTAGLTLVSGGAGWDTAAELKFGPPGGGAAELKSGFPTERTGNQHSPRPNPT